MRSLCPQCGYDRSGDSSERCPECGSALRPGPPEITRWWVGALLLLACAAIWANVYIVNLRMIQRGDASNWRASTGMIAAMMSVVSLTLTVQSLRQRRRKPWFVRVLFVVIVAAAATVGSFALKDVSLLTR